MMVFTDAFSCLSHLDYYTLWFLIDSVQVLHYAEASFSSYTAKASFVKFIFHYCNKSKTGGSEFYEKSFYSEGINTEYKQNELL